MRTARKTLGDNVVPGGLSFDARRLYKYVSTAVMPL